ncbi:outer membrane beta-barrel protein [Leeuwenhoekiella sp. MAR_2009_132]|uniref:outer membrane beta-barrel protein n=1 Tax=Leeuwenhoekiella sp. MAR_2009_132 TaxID=1392489 RepID=UPI0039775AA5
MFNLRVRNNLDFIKRFGSRGAYLRLDLSQEYNNQENDNLYFSESNFFGANARTETQDQFIAEDEKEYQYGLGIEQRLVLATDFYLDLNYNLSSSSSTNSRYVFEADATGDYTVRNDTLSSNFEVKTYRNTPSVGLNYDHEGWRINADVGLLNTILKNDNLLSPVSFDNTYNNLYIRTGIRYELQRSKSIYIDYRTNANTPSIRELQPVPDRTNPLNIVIGNPALRPAYSHNIGGGFRSFNFGSGGGSGIFSSFSLDFTENQVVSVSTIGEDLRRTTTYANVNGAMSASARVFYTKNTRKEAREFRYRLSLTGNHDKNVGFTNGTLFNSKRLRISPGISFTYAIQELFNINPSYSLTYNDTKYSINANRDQEFINHRVGFEATSFWPKNIIFGNDITYNYNGNVSPGFQNSSILWNTSLGYQFLDEKATVKLKVYDLLDQVVDTQRITGDDYVQDTNSLILTQYAMLSLTYKLSNFGGKSGGSPGGSRRRR